MLIRTKVFGFERFSAPKMGAVAWRRWGKFSDTANVGNCPSD